MVAKSALPNSVEVLDSTLREGCQARGVSVTVEDKLRIAWELDKLGVHIIEGGWPGANAKDSEFFKKVRDYSFENSKIAAFTSTRRKGVRAAEDPLLNAAIDAETSVVVVFGKAWDLHVREVLRASLDENLEMIADTIEYLRSHGVEVVFDAEHFFDGFKENPGYALEVIKTAVDCGCKTVVLADTNGGCLPHEVYEIVSSIKDLINARIGVHMHNDSGNAVANTLMAVLAGAEHVQVTVNGIGERCGNADLCQVIPNLELKLGVKALKTDKPLEHRLRGLTRLSKLVYELTGAPRNPYQPYVGDYAFAHKAGVHVDAVLKNPRAYEHVNPELVGNTRRFTVSDVSGRANIVAKALEELGLRIDKRDPRIAEAVAIIKELEAKGYSFDDAPASAMLILLRSLGLYKRFFELVEWRIVTESGDQARAWGWVKVRAENKEIIEVGEGVGPVHAADIALRKALEKLFPELRRVKLVDYRVVLLGAPKHTASTVRVVITFTDGLRSWSTSAASANIIEASVKAVTEGLDYYLQASNINRHNITN